MAVKAWFAARAFGQLLFCYRLALTGDFAGWAAKEVISGYVAGETVGNGNFAAHVLVAAVMATAGLLQLVPSLRARWSKLHRWSGRIFIATALFLSIGGLWLTCVRGAYLTLTYAVAISIDAALTVGP